MRYVLFVLHRPTADWWHVDSDQLPTCPREIADALDSLAVATGEDADNLAVNLIALDQGRPPTRVELS